MQRSNHKTERSALSALLHDTGSFRSTRAWVRGLFLLFLIAGLGLQNTHGLAAPPNQNPVWTITSPREGTTVSGEVAIQGTATHPNFDSYGVLYATGPRPTADSDWVPIVFGVKSSVVNGTLATWDTTQMPNGQYTLALAVFEQGNTEPNLHFTNNITISNEETTPTPSPTPEETETGEPGPEEGATTEAGPPPAAPTIVQPPTATPRPTPTLSPALVGGDEDGGDGEDNALIPGDIFSLDAVKESFRIGVQLAFLVYAIGILYVLAKAVIRYYMRQTQEQATTSPPEGTGS